MSLIAQLLEVVSAYSAATGLSDATVSTRFFRGGAVVRELRSGARDMGVKRIESALAQFSAEWPDGVAWPADVPRPVAQAAE